MRPFVYCALFLCFLGLGPLWRGSAFAAPRKKLSVESAAYQTVKEGEISRLRVGEPAVLVEERRGTRVINYVSVEVKNISTVAAQDIQVSAGISSGPSFPMRGPKKLQPGQRAVYSTRAKLPVTGGGLRILANCATCRR